MTIEQRDRRPSHDGRHRWDERSERERSGGSGGGASRRAWAERFLVAGALGLAGWALVVVGDAEPRRATVLVYRLRDGMSPYERASYVPSERTSRGEGTGALLREALRELVEGVTPEEREAGFESIFSGRTSEIVDSVELADGRAIVDFTDLRSSLPAGGTSEGGTIMLAELNHTIFQFDPIDEVEYRMNGSCAAFWRFLQASCHMVTRAEFEQAP